MSVIVKVSGIIRSVAKFGNIVPQWLWLAPKSLPTSIGGLKKLRVLDISYSRVQELPKDFGDLESLVDFRTIGCFSVSRS